MRKLAVLLFFVAVAIPALAVKRLTLKQLDQALADVGSKPDQEVARSLSGLELTERMSTQELMRWKSAMPGLQSRLALTALADASVFLSPPSEATTKTAPMDTDAQRQLLSLSSAYVEKAMRKLPNFFASQAVVTFEDTPGARNSGGVIVYKPLHYVNFVRADVLYRNGREVKETLTGELSEKDQASSRLLFTGEFGPILNTVLADAQQGKLTWSHWEAGVSSQVAVFRYSVARGKSHCTVKILLPGSGYANQTRPGYHGEIAVDPISGTILRLTLIADLISDDPMSTANLIVEYGPVEIGGQAYICPIRSVTLVMAYPQNAKESVAEVAQSAGGGHGGAQVFTSNRDIPPQTLLNDVAFERYHVLRSDARIITGPEMQDEKKSP